jgi:hypothetical protein
MDRTKIGPKSIKVGVAYIAIICEGPFFDDMSKNINFRL